MMGVSLSTAGGCIYLLMHRKKRMTPIGKTPIRMRSVCGMLLKMAAPVAVAAGLMQLCAMIDTLTIQPLLCRAESAPDGTLITQFGRYLAPSEQLHTFLYGALMSCMTLFHLIPAFTAVFSKSALSCITRAYTGKDRRERSESVRSLFFMTALVAMPAVFGFAFLAEPLLKLLYPTLPEWWKLVHRFCRFLQFLRCAWHSLSHRRRSCRQRENSKNLLPVIAISAVVKLICNLWLVRLPQVHIMVLLLVHWLVIFCWYCMDCGVLQKKRIGTYSYLKNVKKPLIGGFLCGIGVFFTEKALTNTGENSIITFVSIAVGALIYGLSLLFLRVINPSAILFKGKRAEKSKKYLNSLWLYLRIVKGMQKAGAKMTFKTERHIWIEDLREIMRVLRSENGCPWDREQTHASIRKDFIEETYEVIEAIDEQNPAMLREELGDVLLQVVFHTQIEEEAGAFSFDGCR